MTGTTISPITHIVRTSGICGGAPRINGTRITVDWIVGQMIYAGRTLDDIIEDYAHVPLTPAQIHAALSYYYDHQAQIEELISQSEGLFHELQQGTDD